MKKFTGFYLLTVVLGLAFCLNTHAQISGSVFRDFNANGVKDSTSVFVETGVAGVKVTAYNQVGSAVSTTTATNGSYTLATATGGKYRVEFTDFAGKDFDGAIGSSSNTSVQFVDVTAGGISGINLGINYPDHYSDGSPPPLFTPCYSTGNEASAGGEKVFVKWNYNSSGVPQMFGGTGPNPEALATLSQLGTVWGVAYDKNKQLIYTSAFLKRHTILLNNGKPDNGLGNVFSINPVTGNPTLLFNLQDLGINVGTIPDNATRGITGGITTPSQDSLAYDLIGKVGIGDIDISTDAKTLWAVVINEADPRLVAIKLDADNNPTTAPTAGDVQSWPVTSPCTGGQSRPFGLKYYRGQLYVGIVCDAGNSQNKDDLSASVLRFDPATQAFTNVLSLPLNYEKGKALDYAPCDQYPGWYPWTNDYTFPPAGTPVCTQAAGPQIVRPTPMLTDIEFDVDGSMILGFSDRWGNQVGFGNNSPLGGGYIGVGSTGGDLLRAAPNGNGGYILESNGTSGGITTASAGNNQGPGGGEYYNEGLGFHKESSQGGITFWPGSGEVITTFLDPIEPNTGGIGKFNNKTGEAPGARRFQIFAGGFGKANGLGDLEFVGSEAPIQIGNRVWKDTDGDGIQDAEEPPLAGVTVALLENCTGNPIATATTDANGNYYFSSAAGSSTASAIYGVTLKYTTAYCLKVTSLGSDPSVTGLTLTTVSPAPGETSGVNNTGTTLSNNDAFIIGGQPTISLTIGNAGENNYTYDFGFPVCTKPNAGTDLKICAPATTSALTAAVSGQTWSQLGTTPAVAAINASGAVTGLTVDGTYLFTLSAGAGCSDTVAITRSSVIVTISGPTTICSTELPISFTASPAGGSFNNGLPTGVTVSGNVLTITVGANLSSLSFNYTYTDPVTGCSANDQKAVTISSGGTKVNIGTDTLCVNQTATYTDPNGLTGTWSGPGITDTGTGATLNSAVALTALGVSAPASFYIYYTQTSGNCSRIDSGLVLILPRPSVSITGPSTVCANALPVNFTASPAGGSYSLPNGLPAGAVTQNGTTLTLNAGSGLSSLTFSYQYTDAGTGCSNTASHTITITPKPNAGTDKSLTCANPTAGTLQTSTTLTGFTPAGGTWAANTGNPAVASITNLGAVSGMTVAGTYLFIYDANGCKDTVAVTVEPCTGCVKPNAGTDVTICAPAVSAKLTAVTPGGVWAPQAGNPAAATIDASGNIAGITAVGTYTFIYSVTLGGQTCTDTASVILKAKPVATIATPANGEVCTTAGVAQLSATPAGGTWSVVGAPAGITVTNLGAVAGLSSVGTYSFIYSINGCSDTIALTAKVCQIPCPKPIITLSAAPVCSPGSNTYSVSFTITGQVGILKVNNGSLSGSNPYTVTGIPGGASLKITDSLSVVCKYDTLVAGPNCNCTPQLPTVLTPSLTVCAGDTFPTLKATIIGQAVAEWFAQPTGGAVLFTGINYKPSGTIAVTDTFYVQAKSTDQNCPLNSVSERIAVTVNVQNCNVTVDLALKKLINKKIAHIGDTLIYTLKVWNESVANATGVEVTDSLATSVQFITGSFTAGRGSASLSGSVIKWTIGNIAAQGDTVTLTYKIKAIGEGVHFNVAEISKTNEKDKDSTPGNGKEEEDDLDRQCFTVPVKLCAGEKVQLNISEKYTNVKWYKAGSSIVIAQGNEVLFSETGTYSFTASNSTCPVEGCCPIIIEPSDTCCPTNVCIPFKVNKVKKSKLI
ncbi:SdrD B-like domain-containing protein [Runella sp.]|uniref:SdrD B-like domain-containing protein n=1 Tax=Runella sp. TaxID=1960881 RepID=UPI003D0C29CC